MKKIFSVRFFSLVLALLMLVPFIAGCTDGGDDNETTDASDKTQPNSVTDTVTAEPSVFDNADFNQTTVSFLTWSDVEHEEFSVETQNADAVNDAIYTRNLRIEDTLNVKLDFSQKIPGNASHIDDFVSGADTISKSNPGSVDIIAAHSQTIGNCVFYGLCNNLLDSAYLDFSEPWWPDSLINQATINKKLYFCSGDISANMLYMMYVVYFNKDLAKEYNLGDLYSLVDSNEWTYDKFFSLTSGIYEDINRNNVKDVGDQFGYSVYALHADPWFYGSGSTILESNNDGTLIVSPSRSDAKIQDILQKVNNLLWVSNDGMYVKASEAQTAFSEGRQLFISERSRIVIDTIDTSTLKFGVMPFPKYSAAQENYYTIIGNPFTNYAVSSTTDDYDAATAALGYMAKESYELVTPALFYITMKVRYSDSDQDSRMFDIVRESVIFDLGRIFSNVLIPQNKFRNMISDNNSDWASTVATTTPQLQEKLNALNDSLSK